jgi:hypothetical protein
MRTSLLAARQDSSDNCCRHSAQSGQTFTGAKIALRVEPAAAVALGSDPVSSFDSPRLTRVAVVFLRQVLDLRATSSFRLFAPVSTRVLVLTAAACAVAVTAVAGDSTVHGRLSQRGPSSLRRSCHEPRRGDT